MHGSRDDASPANEPITKFDHGARDMALEDLNTIIYRVKQSNGIFPNKFYQLLEDLLYLDLD